MKHYTVGLTDIVELDPSCLKIAMVDAPPSRITLKNYVNGGYFWHQANGATYPLGILVSEGKVLSNTQPHGKPAGTFIVYKDGTVAVKELLSISAEKDVWFVISGCSILPTINMISAGFTGVYADIGRSTTRPVLGYRKSDSKVIIAVRKFSNIARGRQTLLNLGCDFGITLDAGGSTALCFNGKMLVNTTRRLNNVIQF